LRLLLGVLYGVTLGTLAIAALAYTS